MAIDRLGNTIALTRGLSRRVRTVTGAVTLTSDDDVIVCAGTAPFTITLPTAASAYDSATGTSKVFTIINPDTDDATIDGSGAETINGAATLVLDVQYEWCELFTDGTAWYALV